MLVTTDLRRCSTCGVWKHPEDFHHRTSARTTRRAVCKACDRELRRANRYGLSVASVRSLEDEHDGLCANSGCDNLAAVIDHDHDEGFVRGLLCQGCNLALGMLADSEARILGLAEYISRHESRTDAPGVGTAASTEVITCDSSSLSYC